MASHRLLLLLFFISSILFYDIHRVDVERALLSNRMQFIARNPEQKVFMKRRLCRGECEMWWGLCSVHRLYIWSQCGSAHTCHVCSCECGCMFIVCPVSSSSSVMMIFQSVWILFSPIFSGKHYLGHCIVVHTDWHTNDSVCHRFWCWHVNDIMRHNNRSLCECVVWACVWVWVSRPLQRCKWLNDEYFIMFSHRCHGSTSTQCLSHSSMSKDYYTFSSTLE